MTTEQTHGHEILDLVAANPEGITPADLTSVAAEKFGADALYYTCSAEGLALPTLLEFLIERDKVRMSGGLILSGGSPACSHDHH